ncbi:MAG: LamB/YcsF family protein [Opitutaceae bacterium]|nr:LamB/YcsF family protein [Opitutaceae bacterium]
MKTIDLNADLGEGGGQDAVLMPLVTSANIACGAHAGDADTMRASVELAQRHGVSIGAHTGFVDRENFGRVERPIGPAEVAALVTAQVMRLQEIAQAAGAVVGHVKLHGALYNQVSRDRELSEAVVAAIRSAGKHLILYALAGSELEKAARRAPDFAVVAEAFADRTYQADGTLTPRSRPEALIHSPEAAAAQVRRIVREGFVRATDGTDVPLRAGTVCVHGDGPAAVALTTRLRAALEADGIELAAPRGSGQNRRTP